MNKFEKITTGLGEECGVFGSHHIEWRRCGPHPYIMGCWRCSTEDRRAAESR